jgi:hypothetical protein
MCWYQPKIVLSRPPLVYKYCGGGHSTTAEVLTGQERNRFKKKAGGNPGSQPENRPVTLPECMVNSFWAKPNVYWRPVNVFFPLSFHYFFVLLFFCLTWNGVVIIVFTRM